jgi:hypothetical protein
MGLCHHRILADHGDLQELDSEARASEGKVREQSECNEADGAAGGAATSHVELPYSHEGAPHVAAL